MNDSTFFLQFIKPLICAASYLSRHYSLVTVEVTLRITKWLLFTKCIFSLTFNKFICFLLLSNPLPLPHVHFNLISSFWLLLLLIYFVNSNYHAVMFLLFLLIQYFQIIFQVVTILTPYSSRSFKRSRTWNWLRYNVKISFQFSSNWYWTKFL